MTSKRNTPDVLGMGCPMSRRDFINGVLVGSGAALLSGALPVPGMARTLDTASAAPLDTSPSGSAWTGYGGIGEYRWSNGNTGAVRHAGHAIRDRRYPDVSAMPVEETHDLVVIGGGFSGLTAAYEFSKQRKPNQTCLLLEIHPMIGGEAKLNEFNVDGHHLVAPQASTGAYLLKEGETMSGRYAAFSDYYHELGMPSRYDLEPLAGGAEKYSLPNDPFDPMYLQKQFPTGYFFPEKGWVKDPIAVKFANTPWPVRVQKQIDEFVNNRRDVISAVPVADADRWLDSMSYYDLLDKLGYGPEVKQYIDPLLGVGNFGVCGNALSAYAAKRLTLPGTIPSNTTNRFVGSAGISFPGGNSAFLRKMLARMRPDVLPGDGSLVAAVQTPINFAALDQPGAAVRIRLQSAAVHVRHDGDPSTAGSVIVTYAKEGKLHNVRAKAAVLGSAGQVNRNIVADLPPAYAEAYGQFRYGPVLVANVAIRNWRFFDQLGFTTARWFTGLGWHVCVRQNVTFAKNAPALTPDSPIVLTFYIALLNADIDPVGQGVAGRAQLLGTSYADYERQIREQMSVMFASAGFDARRDIAGIILNRWGHAYLAPGPGFFFGRNGQPAPPEVISKPHGRIIFAYSELQGNMNMAHAMLEGRRGANLAMAML